jgi:peptidoglycan hydrolase-like protein with peptidoglycan-binding domain/3D (Asp-Asp-Asp) domain-containing protein
MRGSYEADKKLNGNGTNGADGSEVFMGMLAAPKSYQFSTSIDLPGLGVGEVHDRGGAIKEKKKYHRIDVWMGHGDEGLTRSLNWGMRYVTGKVYFAKKAVPLSLSFLSVPSASPKITKKKADVMVINKNIKFGQVDSQVVKLKEILFSLGYFKEETQNNFFGEALKRAVIKFQVDQKIVSSANSYEAGYVGVKTRTMIQKKIKSPIVVTATKSAPVKQITSMAANQKESIQLAIQAGVGKNSQVSDVKNLQVLLAAIGYYQADINGKYSDEMVAAVFAFQKDQGILKSQFAAGAGHFGPKTQKALLRVLKQREEKLALFPASKSEILVLSESKNSPLVKNKIPLKKPKLDLSNYPADKTTLFLSPLIGKNKEELKKYLAKKGFLEYKSIDSFFGSHGFKSVNLSKAEIFEK